MGVPNDENSSIADKGAFNIAGSFALLKGIDVDFRKHCYRIGKPVISAKIKIPFEYVPIAINVIEPFYRDTIFETQNLEKVVLEIESNLDKKDLVNAVFDVEIRKRDAGKALLREKISKPKTMVKAEFDCKKLPYGKLDIVAILKDKNGKILAETKHPLQKLPYKKGEVWLDRDLNWHVDGKLFFLVGAWPVSEDRNKYYNTVLVWRMEPAPSKTIIAFYSSQTHKHRIAFDDYIKKFTREQVAKYRDNPELYIGIPYLTQELAYLGKAVLAPESKLKLKTSSDKVKTLLKDVNGELYLFVSNADMKPREVKITIPGVRKYANRLNVISEDRKIRGRCSLFIWVRNSRH